jgi:hypothetical protein
MKVEFLSSGRVVSLFPIVMGALSSSEPFLT